MVREKGHYVQERNNRGFLLSTYNQYYKSFTGHLAEGQKRLNKKSIHSLRLDIKGLRTVYEFLNLLDPKEDAYRKYFKPIQKLYRQAGTVREEQVNLSILRKFNSSELTSAISESFISRKQSAYRRLHLAFDELDIGEFELMYKMTTERIEATLEDEIEKKCRIYIRKKTRKINKLKKDLTDSNLHEIRKGIKAIRTIENLQQKMSPENVPVKLPSGKEKLDMKIGNWHNNLIFLNSLKEFSKQNLPDQFKGEIKKMIVKTRKQKNERILKIEKELRKRIN
jgi:CHAD domain-containing protein